MLNSVGPVMLLERRQTEIWSALLELETAHDRGEIDERFLEAEIKLVHELGQVEAALSRAKAVETERSMA